MAGSLVLGFLDLQAGRAQTRFYTELENWLSSVTDLGSEMALSKGAGSEDMKVHIEQLTQRLQGQGQSGRSSEALSSLVESIQQMVKHMRTEQDITRRQLTQQEEQQKDMLMLMRQLNAFFEKASK